MLRGGLGYTADQLRAMGFEGQAPIYGVANSDAVAGEQSLVGNSAAIDCIRAEQNIYVAGTVADYIKELIYQGGPQLTDSQKQWAWSQWNALAAQISPNSPNNTAKDTACQASFAYAQARGYDTNDPIINIITTPYEQQMMVDGSGYTLAQMIGIGKQAIDYHLFGRSQNGPAQPSGIVAVVDIPSHTVKYIAIGVNTGLSPAQLSSPSLRSDPAAELYGSGPNAVQLALNNPEVSPVPNVSVPIPAGIADNGQIVPASMSNPFGTNSNPINPAAVANIPAGSMAPVPAPATTTDFMTQLQTPYAGVPLWGWLAGAGVAAAVLL